MQKASATGILLCLLILGGAFVFREKTEQTYDSFVRTPSGEHFNNEVKTIPEKILAALPQIKTESGTGTKPAEPEKSAESQTPTSEPASPALSPAAVSAPPSTAAPENQQAPEPEAALPEPQASWPPKSISLIGFGEIYKDPAFGTTIKRITNDRGFHSQSDIYVKNGFWNADGTLMMHKKPGNRHIIDTDTGAVVASNIPGNADGSFDPANPDIWYHTSGNSLGAFNARTGAKTTVKVFSGELKTLGGSVDWIDKSGRYMLLNISGSLRVWDKASDLFYEGYLPADFGEGWAGISPDGNYVIVAKGEKYSYRINHGTKTLETGGTLFWTLCGDHGDLLSASNGKTYFVSFECHSQSAVYRIDVTLPQTKGGILKQQNENKKLFPIGWSDHGHISCVSEGSLKDWCFISITSGDDTFENPGPQRPYKSEVLMANVLTGEIKELAHHRSRGISENYYYHPRVSAAWSGNKIAWASNFGIHENGYVDLYTLSIR